MHPDEQFRIRDMNQSPESTQGESESLADLAEEVIAWERFDMLWNNDDLADRWHEACNPEDILALVEVCRAYHDLCLEFRNKGAINMGGYVHRISELARKVEKSGFPRLLK